LWDAKSGRLIGDPLGDPLAGLKGVVDSIAFSPDSRRIVSGHGDGMRLWDARTGQAIGVPLASSKRGAISVAYSADGTRLVSAGGGSVRLWPAPKAWPDEVCAKLTRNMSRKQWSEWVSPEIPYACQCPGLPIPPDDPSTVAATESCPGVPVQAMFR
jgi:WD40 repeat protein